MTAYVIAKEISYPNEDGSAPVETSYDYQWYTDSVQMLQRTTTLPAVGAEQNGSDTSATASGTVRRTWPTHVDEGRARLYLL